MNSYNWDSYIELQDFLETIEQELNKLNDDKLAKEVSSAKSFFGMNTPGEYMEESYGVLKRVVNQGNLPKEVNDKINAMLSDIKLSFKAIGSDLD